MNQDNFEGAVKSGAGKVESFAGQTLGDDSLKAKGEGLQTQGKIQDALGSVHGAIDKVAGSAKAAASQVNSQAADLYTKVSQTGQGVAAKVDPFVEEQPYVALGLAVAAGVLTGLLLGSRGPKVIYIKTRD